MSVSKRISNVNGEICGTMICHKKITSGEYLVEEHYISKRGNEDDYYSVFHKKCSIEDSTWKEHEKEKISDKKRIEKELEENKKMAFEIIKNASYISITENDDGFEINIV